MFDEVELVLLHRCPIAGAGLFDLGLQAWHALEHIEQQLVAVQVVDDCHVERRGSCAFLAKAPHMKPLRIGAFVHQAVDQRRIAVEGKDDRSIFGERPITARFC